LFRKLLFLSLIIKIASFSNIFHVTNRSFRSVSNSALSKSIVLRRQRRTYKRASDYSYKFVLTSIIDDDNLDDFNPFDRKGDPRKENINSIQIPEDEDNTSLRQFKMKDMMAELIRVADESSEGDEKLRSILLENEELLMDPFDNIEKELDSDSIYKQGMGKNERFDHFRMVMSSRIKGAQKKASKLVLQAMMEFVLDHDERGEGGSTD